MKPLPYYRAKKDYLNILPSLVRRSSRQRKEHKEQGRESYGLCDILTTKHNTTLPNVIDLGTYLSFLLSFVPSIIHGASNSSGLANAHKYSSSTASGSSQLMARGQVEAAAWKLEVERLEVEKVAARVGWVRWWV
ncbi:hypothetical protein M5K25_016253 [Dendrobium thyrsiflorum]|uniref:Uncharacterized protein n=1 Tax=Dendrobium thyrsiflorum TaxID=117978 RepID=A0ABD0UJB8_DENTH